MLNIFILQKYLSLFIICFKCRVWTQNMNYHSIDSPLFSGGKPSEKLMTYSLFINEGGTPPVMAPVVTPPPISQFDFQTEEDYSYEMEAEMEWINDRKRLEEQNVVPPNPYISTDQHNQNDVKPQQMANPMNGVNHQIYYTHNQNDIQSNSDSNGTHNWKKLPKNISSNEKESFETVPNNPFPYDLAQNDSTNINSSESVTENVGQWQQVIDKNGKKIEQRVIALPHITYNFPKGLHQIGRTQIITESEQMMTQTLKPIIEEKELELPEKRF